MEYKYTRLLMSNFSKTPFQGDASYLKAPLNFKAFNSVRVAGVFG
jgi:hypothetical protein